MKIVKISQILVIYIAMIMCTGCFSSRAKDIEAFARPYKINVNATNYILQPPDEIEVFSSKISEINLQNQRIRPDGKISFEGLGEVKVAGKTPAQVAEILRKKASELYTLSGDQPIDVRVAAFRSKVYYVLGEVGNPGPRNYTGRNTLFNAITEAQPEVTGWEKHIQVIRPSVTKSVKPKIFEIDFNKMKSHGDLSKNVMLNEGDIIYVPPTPLASVAMKIEEFVRPISRALAPVYTVSTISGTPGGGF